MMTLKLQVITLLFSFLFGFIFNLIITLLYKLIYNRNIIIQILSTLIITLSTTFAYFIMLKKINEAIIHPYFLLLFILGFVIFNYFSNLFLKSY